MGNSTADDKKKLIKLLDLIQKEGTLSEISENEIISLFGTRGEKAIGILKDHKLHKHVLNEKLAIWEVEGKCQNYLIIEDNFCECTDFQIRVLIRGEKTLCYHLLAKIVGDELHLYKIRKISNEEYDKLMLSRT